MCYVSVFSDQHREKTMYDIDRKRPIGHLHPYWRLEAATESSGNLRLQLTPSSLTNSGRYRLIKPSGLCVLSWGSIIGVFVESRHEKGTETKPKERCTTRRAS